MRALLITLILTSVAGAKPPADHRANNPSSGHGIFAPHAETIGEGNVSLDLYQIIGIVGVTYAPTDDVQISTHVVPIGLIDQVLFGFLSTKWVFLRDGALRLAVDFETIFGVSDGFVIVGGANLLADVVFDGGALHFGLGGFFAGGGFGSDGTFGNVVGDGDIPIRALVGIDVDIDDWLTMLLEVQPLFLLSTAEFAVTPIILAARIHDETSYLNIGAGAVLIDDEVGGGPIINGGFRF